MSDDLKVTSKIRELITESEEPAVRLLAFAAICALIGSRDCYSLEQTSEDTGLFDGYGNPVPSVEKARLSTSALAQIRATSKAVADAVIEEAKRLRAENNEDKREGE